MNNRNWNKMYKLAINYYNCYGNLEIRRNFKTFDGINEDENGVSLGCWIQTQRQSRKGHGSVKITEEQIEKLDQIGMIWDIYEKNWNEMYELANHYYNHYGNLEIQEKFKTVDGINKNDKGVELGYWIRYQRYARFEQIRRKITEEQIEKLDQIGMIWDIYEKNWNRMYELAKKYYDYYGNLEIKYIFKTLDGINEDENGITLGAWIRTQRQAKKGQSNSKLTEKRIRKLEEIGMIWDYFDENWNEMYELADRYYKYYSDLRIKKKFKTLDGINEDENGVSLGCWIQTQRQAKKGNGYRKITEEQIQKLDQIGMIWDIGRNNLDIINLCKQYRIDINKNKDIKKKSYNEVFVKICYLNENNISIYDNQGKIHSIFFMSDINMQIEYNVSLQELIKRYKKDKVGGVQNVFK